MKIGLATIYKCYNFGSFYQAYGLQKHLEDLGHNVYFLPLDDLYNKKYRLRKQFNRDIKRDLFSLKSCLAYNKDWHLLKIAKKSDRDFDLVIIGSDEIWSINNKTFTPAPEYYGVNLPCEKAFCYATCVGRSGFSDFKERPDLLEGIRALSFVSARDEATGSFLKTVLNRDDIPRVLDPSFLIDWSKIEKPFNRKNYILVYTYDGSWGFSNEQIKATKDFAKSQNLPLVSVGFKNDWCDKSVAASPREFLGYLRNASFVVTDTFHGTAMSIQYKKQFISMGKGKQKVESLLDEFGLANRVCSDENPFEKIVSNPVDYTAVDKIIGEKLDFSKAFLSEKLHALK